MKSSTDLLALARQRRLTALATLKSHENNLFAIADFRIRAASRARQLPFFSSTRVSRVSHSLIETEEKRAA